MHGAAKRILKMNSGQLPVAESPEPIAVNSDVVVVMAALLCAIICVVGLTFAARCAWTRRSPSFAVAVAAAGPASSAPYSNKGLKKKSLKALPKVRYSAAAEGGDDDGDGGMMRLSECAICLAEFADGDELRILPPCGHRFHVGCVDTWLVSHSSCPSCRRLLVVVAAAAPPPSRCQRCGANSISSNAAVASPAGDDGGANSFLP